MVAPFTAAPSTTSVGSRSVTLVNLPGPSSFTPACWAASQMKDAHCVAIVPLAQPESGPATPAGPVSYTHLRAHETGRNLVCRLLHEKKKVSDDIRNILNSISNMRRSIPLILLLL